MATGHNLVEKCHQKVSIFHYQGDVRLFHNEKFISLFPMAVTKSNLELQLHPYR